MSVLRKMIWGFMSVVLAVGLMPPPAFAQDSSLQAAGLSSAEIQTASYNNNPASVLTGKDKSGAYAVLYDDGEMLMQRGNANKRAGVGVTAVYSGIVGDYWKVVV